jgi:hypothetical protein
VPPNRTIQVGLPPDVEIIFPTVTLQASGYHDAEVDCGF